VELTPHFVDVTINRMEATLKKIARMKRQGRRASLVGAQMDLMREMDDIVNVMQGCLRDSKNHHQLLVDIFGGDCTRISRCRVVMDHCHDIHEYRSAAPNVESARSACEAVERVLIDLGCREKLQKGRASERLSFLLKSGTATQEEIAAAIAKLRSISDEIIPSPDDVPKDSSDNESTEEEENQSEEHAEEELSKQVEVNLAAQSQEEEALQLEEAKAREQAEQLMQEVGNQGIVEVLHHDVKVSHEEPAPGVRIVVVKHDIVAGKRGTLIDLEGTDQWKTRLDDKSQITLHVTSFETAPPPCAAVHLKDRIEFEVNFRGQPPTAVLSNPDHATDILQEAANVLKNYESVIVSIEGHTATPDDKMDDWAFSLAQGRADKVQNAFIELGIAEHRLKPIGLPGRLGNGAAATLLKIVSM